MERLSLIEKHVAAQPNFHHPHPSHPHHHHLHQGDAALSVAPRPALDEAGAAALAAELFGVRVAPGSVRELGSHQDRNFLLKGASLDHVAAGAPLVSPAKSKLVLKVANRGWSRAALEAQNAALLHLAPRLAVAPGGPIAVPAPVADSSGRYIREAAVGGERVYVRLLTFVEGSPLTGVGYLAPCVAADLGRLSGVTAAALADFSHVGLLREAGAPPRQWDLMDGAVVVRALLPSVRDDKAREEVAAAVDSACKRLAGVTPSLRVQSIHSDITDDNVVGFRDGARRLRPSAVIDFGDLASSWLVGELAVTVTGVLRHCPDDPLATLPAVRAFHAACPLTEPEVAALWPLVLLRGATLVASGEHQASLDPDNPSVTEPLPGEWAIMRAAASLPFEVAEAAIRAALGMPPLSRYQAARTAMQSAAPLLPGVPPIAVADLSPTSTALHSGRHQQETAEERRVLQQAAGGAAAATRWGEARLTRGGKLSHSAPATVALGVDLVVPPSSQVAAPFGATVTAGSAVGSSTPHLALVSSSPPCHLLLRGVHPAKGLAVGSQVVAGAPLGAVATDGHLHVRVCLEPSLGAGPEFVPPQLRHAWLALTADPALLLKCAPLAAPDQTAESAALLARRNASYARSQKHYYSAPMRMERGWRELLIDTEARAYVDTVNNVAALGHSHPKVAAAAAAQLRLLNTNSRFHYGAVARLSETLAAASPSGLDTVFLVNSGSEATDLAMRIAQAVTGRQAIIAVKEAYHGVTYLSDAVTTEGRTEDPAAMARLPPFVHLLSAPLSYRGRFRGPDSGAAYVAEAKQLVASMAAAGSPPAAFIGEPLFGNAGGAVLPGGYLKGVYEAVRAAGGLCIADEVQVGLGRTGGSYWAHTAHGVVPDMITIAKALGNGHPVGAVIVRKEIAEAFGRQGSFFSSAGGGPVSCVVACAVLDAIREEGLQENARVVGGHVLHRCRELMAKYPIIGAVHGEGLYGGIELVRDRETLEPATEECFAICDRLRELGVVCQPASQRNNVLKLKPPMCMSRESADFFVRALETALRDGW